MQSISLFLFLASSVLAWVMSFGYWLVLYSRARRPKPPVPVSGDDAPLVTVIVPILNEERFVHQKLDDLQRTRYPSGRLRIVVADGGSNDRSTEYVSEFEARNWPVELMHVNSATGKADQVSVALDSVDTEFVVLTDVDTTLEPDCILCLVEALKGDPQCAIMGARVVPVTGLAEEKLHWDIVNSLWYLEGEAFGAAAVSGVCNAIRPALYAGLPVRGKVDNLFVVLESGSGGHEMRTSPSELEVLAGFVDYPADSWRVIEKEVLKVFSSSECREIENHEPVGVSPVLIQRYRPQGFPPD